MFRRIVAALFLAGISLIAQAQACIPRKNDNPFKPGETLQYDILYKWGAVNTVVAKANFSLDEVNYNDSPVFHSLLTVKSAPFFDMFFKMREHFEGWMTEDDIRPVKFVRDTHEGAYAATNLFYYDWDQRIIHADVNYESRGPEHIEIPLKDCVTDIGSILYYTRGMDTSSLKVGSSYPLRFAIDDTIFDIHLTYKGKETVARRRFGSFRCLKFSCSVVAGAMFDGTEDFLIWISDDGNLLPVTFRVPLRVGAMRGWINAWGGLKYDFSSFTE